MSNINSNKCPLVYIIVLCHNSAKWLETCIKTLRNTSYCNFKIVIVDNDSTDGSIDKIEKTFEDIIVIKSPKNVGWCKGNNLGIKRALEDGAKYVVTLNSDIKAEDNDWLNQLVDFAEKNNEYGIYGCTQYEYDSNGWDELNNWTEYILYHGNRYALFMHKEAFSESKDVNAYTKGDIVTKEALDCYFVQGAAMMIRADLFYTIGLFDEIYFIFYDEVDFCRRARILNIKTALITKSRIKHMGSGDNSTNKKTLRRRNFYFSRNKYIFLLTDIEQSMSEIINMTIRFFKLDIIDAIKYKKDVSDIIQFFHIIGSLVYLAPKIIFKRKHERNLNITDVKEV